MLMMHRIAWAVVWITIGIILHYGDYYSHKKHSHFSHHLDTSASYTFEVVDELWSNSRYYIYVADITKLVLQHTLKEHYTNGRTIVYLKKYADKQTSPLEIGSVYTSPKLPEPIPTTDPALLFDYSSIMGNKGIRYQVYLKPTEVQRDSLVTSSYWKKLVKKQRESFENIWRQAGLSETTVQLFKSLLYGERREMDRGFVNAFRENGIMHLLVISGMHIGALYLVLSFLLHKLKLGGYYRSRRWWRAGIIFFMLGYYLLLVGMSPAATRAVVMLFLYELYRNKQRVPRWDVIMIGSAFVLVMPDTTLVFSIGFQLSYIALLGIYYIYPYIENQFRNLVPNYKSTILTQYLVQSTLVSISAQWTLLPLLLYYFHEVSLLFIISNVVIAPLIIFLFITSLIFLLTGIFPFLIWVSSFINHMVDSMYSFLSYVSHRFDRFIINEVYLTDFTIGSLIVFMLLFTYLIVSKRSKKRNLWVVLSFSLISLVYSYLHDDYKKEVQYRIFANYNDIDLGVVERDSLFVFTNRTEAVLLRPTSSIRDYMKRNRVAHLQVLDRSSSISRENWYKTENSFVVKGIEIHFHSSDNAASEDTKENTRIYYHKPKRGVGVLISIKGEMRDTIQLKNRMSYHFNDLP